MRNVEHLVKLYAGIGFTNKEILNLLAHQHQIIISIRTLKRLCKRLCLFRRISKRFRCFSGNIEDDHQDFGSRGSGTPASTASPTSVEQQLQTSHPPLRNPYSTQPPVNLQCLYLYDITVMQCQNRIQNKSRHLEGSLQVHTNTINQPVC